ncbi:MAG TPA: hypothetical protein VF085_07670 [Solirubrobacterales bacterium]
MSRNLKALGLALAAVFALSAIASSAASATEASFPSGSNWTILSSTSIGEQVFEASATESVKCKSVDVDGSANADQEALTVTPTYGKTLANKVTLAEAEKSECTVTQSGVTRPATVHTNLCHYTLFAGNEVDGTMNITDTSVPPAKCEIQITVYFLGEFRPCLDVPPQTPTHPTVTYTNETYVSGGKTLWDVKVKSDIEGITFTRTGVCTPVGHVGNGAKYFGEFTVKGTDTAGTPVNLTWDPET